MVAKRREGTSLQLSNLTYSTFKTLHVDYKCALLERCVDFRGAKERHVEFQSVLQVRSCLVPRQQQPQTALWETEPDGSVKTMAEVQHEMLSRQAI